jgi:hypothetical protein
MNNNLFQNDHITGNSKIGFEFNGQFKDDENVLLTKLKDILNRDVTFSNVKYKLLEPTDNHAVMTMDGKYCEVKTPQYSYFEALFILPKILELLKTIKDEKNSYLYFRIGFNKDFCDVSQVNVMKFILEFNEDYVLKHLIDLTLDGSFEKLTDIKPESLDACLDTIKKRMETMKVSDYDEIYGIDFSTVKLGYVVFKYAKEMKYRNKWEEILKSINHTIITLFNTSSSYDFTNEERQKIDELDEKYKEISKAFSCYELFKEKYKGIKLTKDLNTDNMEIDIIVPSIKDKLFDIVVRSGIKEAEINYDSDISRMQLKNLEIKKSYFLSGVDIVDSELTNCTIRDCDIYDTKIEKSSIVKCNMFGYADCKECKVVDSFVSRNIKLKDCRVTGPLGKMGGIMKGGSLKNTTVITSMADIDDDVEKTNVNEIQ